MVPAPSEQGHFKREEKPYLYDNNVLLWLSLIYLVNSEYYRHAVVRSLCISQTRRKAGNRRDENEMTTWQRPLNMKYAMTGRQVLDVYVKG